jgi:dTDP-4-amino-4,6-dideoxygalactose transaminase
VVQLTDRDLGDGATAPIPFVDLAGQHAEVADQFAEGLQEVLATTGFVAGRFGRAFEEAYASFSGTRHCIGVANGTDAIELALRAAGVGVGDEVVLPGNTFIATAEAVARIGARTVLADIDATTALIDPQHALDLVGPRTRAVLPVHLYGQMAFVDDLAKGLADHDDVVLIEDAAQSHGATRHGDGPATHGIAAATSFYPGKNLGAYGDAGGVLTNDDELARQLMLMRDHGSGAKYRHDVLGFNSRMDEIQAVVLAAKLERLTDWNRARQEAAQRYDDLLADVADLVRPVIAPGNTHVWHLYVVEVANRDEVLAALQAAGIGAGVHYPVPVHLQPAFADLGLGEGALPRCEASATRILSLPMHPHLTAAQQERVVSVVRDAVEHPA